MLLHGLLETFGHAQKFANRHWPWVVVRVLWGQSGVDVLSK